MNASETLAFVQQKCRAAANRTKDANIHSSHSGFRLGGLFCVAVHPGPVDYFGFTLPAELRQFWEVCNHAKLFYDLDYGQWGLELLTPEASIVETQSACQYFKTHWRTGDFVIGHFLGDSEKLVIRCDTSQADYGSITIALPMDNRTDWPIVSTGFLEFLCKYAEVEGDKYWEPNRA